MAVSMYVSYIPQIQANLAGHKGAPLQPLIAAINCTLWVVYGLIKEKRDWAIVRLRQVFNLWCFKFKL